MTEWYKKAGILWTIIGVLFTGLISMIAVNLSYQPEINRLRLENILQDSTIIFLKLDNERLERKVKDNKEEFANIYDVFHTHYIKIKKLEEGN